MQRIERTKTLSTSALSRAPRRKPELVSRQPSAKETLRTVLASVHPVDLAEAQRQHDAFCEVLSGLGVAVHELGSETESPDLVYTYDPALVTDRGMIALRSGKPNREREGSALAAWALPIILIVAVCSAFAGAVIRGVAYVVTWWRAP